MRVSTLEVAAELGRGGRARREARFVVFSSSPPAVFERVAAGRALSHFTLLRTAQMRTG